MGREATNDIVVEQPVVSRKHAMTFYRDPGFWIQDLSSQNGTYVDGQRVGQQPRPLQNGERIQLGSIETGTIWEYSDVHEADLGLQSPRLHCKFRLARLWQTRRLQRRCPQASPRSPESPRGSCPCTARYPGQFGNPLGPEGQPRIAGHRAVHSPRTKMRLGPATILWPSTPRDSR